MNRAPYRETSSSSHPQRPQSQAQARTDPQSRPKTPAGGEKNGREYKDYKDYRIWQMGIEIVDVIYSATDHFPKEELEGLTSQMRKSAVSIPSDVAEGFVRRKEYTEFLYAALGACARLDTQLFITGKRKYLAETKIAAVSEMISEERRMLLGLIRAIQRNQNGQPRFQQSERPVTF